MSYLVCFVLVKARKRQKSSRTRGSRHCVCQVCLSHLRLSAPYANGQGGWEGRLHGKLLVLIQHVEQGRRGVLFNKAPPTPLSSQTHTNTNARTHAHMNDGFSSHVRARFRTNIRRKTQRHTGALPLSPSHTHINTEHLFLFRASKQTCFNM